MILKLNYIGMSQTTLANHQGSSGIPYHCRAGSLYPSSHRNNIFDLFVYQVEESGCDRFVVTSREEGSLKSH